MPYRKRSSNVTANVAVKEVSLTSMSDHTEPEIAELARSVSNPQIPNRSENPQKSHNLHKCDYPQASLIPQKLEVSPKVPPKPRVEISRPITLNNPFKPEAVENPAAIIPSSRQCAQNALRHRQLPKLPTNQKRPTPTPPPRLSLLKPEDVNIRTKENSGKFCFDIFWQKYLILSLYTNFFAGQQFAE